MIEFNSTKTVSKKVETKLQLIRMATVPLWTIDIASCMFCGDTMPSYHSEEYNEELGYATDHLEYGITASKLLDDDIKMVVMLLSDNDGHYRIQYAHEECFMRNIPMSIYA